jgi:hypothetical protein
LPSTLGEVDPDVAEVRLQPLARIVVQRDEGLLPASPPLADVPSYLIVAALVAFLDQPSEDLRGLVPLLPRSLLVRRQDLVDQRLESAQLRSGRLLGPGIRLGLRSGQRLPNLPP